MNTIREFISEHPVCDVHEHHIPELLASPELDLLKLLQQSYAGWTQERPYPLPSESRTEDPMLGSSPPASWEAIRPYLEESGSTMFVRNLLGALKELYDMPPEGITEQTWSLVDEQIRDRHQQASWRAEVLRKARIERVITDPYSSPLLNAKKSLGESYRSVVRMNAFAFGWNPVSVDHNSNSAHALLAEKGLEAGSFEQYLESIETIVARMGDEGQVAIKNALAYDRYIDFDPASRVEAKAVWGKTDPLPSEKKAFGDFMVDHFASLCARYEIPMQVHLGTALIRGSHPLKLASLVERHPKTRFLLMHLAYPWSRDLLGMAFVYRNIWLDLTWSALLSPTHFKLAFHEAIEILPDDSRMMLGGDNWHVEETYGTILTFKRLISEVLEEKVDGGYFDQAHAERLAARILKTNGFQFFGLD